MPSCQLRSQRRSLRHSQQLGEKMQDLADQQVAPAKYLSNQDAFFTVKAWAVFLQLETIDLYVYMFHSFLPIITFFSSTRLNDASALCYSNDDWRAEAEEGHRWWTAYMPDWDTEGEKSDCNWTVRSERFKNELKARISSCVQRIPARHVIKSVWACTLVITYNIFCRV